MDNKKILEDILLSERVNESIRSNQEFLTKIIPPINYMIGFDHKNPDYCLDVWEHTIAAISKSSRILDVRLTLLLGGISKPFCEHGDINRYTKYPRNSSIMAKPILKNLGFDDKYINHICGLIKNLETEITNQAIEEYFYYCEKLYEIQRCDILVSSEARKEKMLAYMNRVTAKLKKQKQKMYEKELENNRINYSYQW